MGPWLILQSGTLPISQIRASGILFAFFFFFSLFFFSIFFSFLQRGGRSNEEGATRRKKQRGERSFVSPSIHEKKRKKRKKKKIEKVAKGRIVDHAVLFPFLSHFVEVAMHVYTRIQPCLRVRARRIMSCLYLKVRVCRRL